MAKTFSELRKDAIEELQERINEVDNFNDDNLADIIYEVTEGILPVYNHDIIDMAKYNPSLINLKPENGPAFGVDTPVNNILSNIYESLVADLHEWYFGDKE